MKEKSPDDPVTIDMASVGNWIDDNKSAAKKLFEAELAKRGYDVTIPFSRMNSTTMSYNPKDDSVNYCFDTGGGNIEQKLPDKKSKYIFEQGSIFDRRIGSARPMENVTGVKFNDGSKTYDVTQMDLVNGMVMMKGFKNEKPVPMLDPNKSDQSH